ncbi:FAD-dependent oxidoreductase [Proteiniclasticum sp.]|uniref:FAD-dependent oxidoreductase n=1 Tax=Proteiniclasticum sp. TaxID=2053595 RepID=UPI00289CA5C6|nr:FAD-dependent oxidoreductase [Proteiniclasticum sp.]
MDYDVIILGGGLVGCSMAYELCKYNLNIGIIEKNFDVAEDVALFNSSLILDGKDIKDDRVFELIRRSNMKLDELSEELDVFYEKVPSFTVYPSREKAEEIYKRAKDRGIEGISLLSTKEANKMNHNIKPSEGYAIYSMNTGVISPYDYATAMAEIAYDNGVSFRLEEEVTDIQDLPRGGIKVTTNKNRYTARVVVRTTFGDKYTIKKDLDTVGPDNIVENMLIEKDFLNEVKHIIKEYKDNGEVITLLPTSTNKLLASLQTTSSKEFSQMKKEVESVIGPFPPERVDIINENRYWTEPIMIDSEYQEDGYIHIQSKNYAVDNVLSALTSDAVELVLQHFKATSNNDFEGKRRKYYRFREMNDEERNEIIKIDPKYGKMICLCSNVTEGEIVDSIRRPMGARTVEGVRRRTGTIFGRCQGSYCLTKVIGILARELHKSPLDIMNDKKDSQVIFARIKEFDSM